MMTLWQVQVELTKGESVMVCWLNWDDRLKYGRSVRLMGIPGWWRITAIYAKHRLSDVKRGWKVGGLK